MCISSDAAVVVATETRAALDGSTALADRLRQTLERAVGDDDASRCRASVSTLLQDHRMLAHDDGEGRPLRYMSLYGGMVTSML